MAATHTYVVTSAVGALSVATVIGTVDTIPTTGPISVTVQVSLGDVLAVNASGGISALETFIAPVMLSAAIKNGLAVPAAVALTQLPTGSFSQNGHTYVVSSVTAVGDAATIVGTVDGTAVTVPGSASQLSAILASTGGLTALETFVAGSMLAAAIKSGLVQPVVTQLPTGSFTL